MTRSISSLVSLEVRGIVSKIFLLGNLRSDVNEIKLRFTPAWDKINGMDQESDVNIGNDEPFRDLTNCEPTRMFALSRKRHNKCLGRSVPRQFPSREFKFYKFLKISPLSY